MDEAEAAATYEVLAAEAEVLAAEAEAAGDLESAAAHRSSAAESQALRRRAAAAARQARLAAEAARQEAQRLADEADAGAQRPPVLQPPPVSTLPPHTEAAARERAEEIVENYRERWPWLGEVGTERLRFFDDAHAGPCEGYDDADGCYHPATGEAWVSLDALRCSFGWLCRRIDGHVVVHELAHAYTYEFPQGSGLLDLFERHYDGCAIGGFEPDVLVPGELLADTMAMAVLTDGWSSRYGYFAGEITGCRTEPMTTHGPDWALFTEVVSTLLNCGTERALDTWDTYRDRLPDSGPMAGNDYADLVLLACYGFDCITPGWGSWPPCEQVPGQRYEDRRAAADERLAAT